MTTAGGMAYTARRARTLLLSMFVVAVPCVAQEVQLGARADSAFQRAQRLASDGDLTGARSVADSVLNASTEGSAAFVEALFWRATLAVSADQARRDYLRIALEYSRAPRAESALLRLAQMEMARGERATARRYLDRLALEHADGRLRAQGEYWMGRAWLEEGALPQACAAFGAARVRLTATDVEFGNQISYYSRPCEAVITAGEQLSRNDSTAKSQTVKKNDPPSRFGSTTSRELVDTGIQRGTARKTVSLDPAWSAQVAAFGARTDAERVVKKLKTRGLDARVTPERPFRVRIGRFVRRSEAAVLVKKLRSQKMTAVVVEAERL